MRVLKMATSEEHCHFYLERKKRYCRFRPKLNQTYCPEHACVMGIQEDRKRIPCPLNPKHNCYEDDLKNHLKKCNVTKSQQANEKLFQHFLKRLHLKTKPFRVEPYYVKDINKGSVEDIKDESTTTMGSVKDLTSAELGKMIDKVNTLYSEVVGNIEKQYLEHPCIKEERSNLDLNTEFGNQAILRKEMLQQGSLVGQLDNLGLLSNDLHYVELGAGKGKLSHWIQKASQEYVDNSFLLVERSSVRYKVDSYHKGKEKERTFHRIKIDIQDLCLNKVPEIQDKKSIVVVGKHLCGGATDLGIRCAVNTLNPFDSRCASHSKSSKSEKSQSPIVSIGTSCAKSFVEKEHHKHSACTENKEKEVIEKEFSGAQSNEDVNKSPSHTCENKDETSVDESYSEGNVEPPAKISRLQEDLQSKSLKGVMIALCCHHQCTWDTYVGREFMRRHGINEREFDLLTRLSSWATCARTRIKGKTWKKKDPHQEKDAKKDEDNKTTNDESKKEEEEENKEEHSVEDMISADLSDNTSLREKLSVAERETIGRKSKRIIDMGRLEYLRSKNLNCCLREYIDEDVTPENVVLLATSSQIISQQQ